MAFDSANNSTCIPKDFAKKKKVKIQSFSQICGAIYLFIYVCMYVCVCVCVYLFD